MEAYFSNEGVFQKWGKDRSRTAQVIVEGTTLNLNITQFLNRAHWVYGEGGGFLAERYAVTIGNMRKAGITGAGDGSDPFSSDIEMYKERMSHGTPAVTLYPGYFNGTAGSDGAKEFAKARENLSDLNENPNIVLSVKAVIGALTGKLKNEEYNNWRGSGNTLYTKEEKAKIEAAGQITEYKNTYYKGKISGRYTMVIDHYFEPEGEKFRRHTFKKYTFELAPFKIVKR